MLKALKKQNEIITGRSGMSPSRVRRDKFDDEPDYEKLSKDIEKVKKIAYKIDPRAEITEDEEPPYTNVIVVSGKFKEIHKKLAGSREFVCYTDPKEKAVIAEFDIAEY